MKPRIDTLYIYLQRERSIMTAEFKKLDQRLHEHDFRFLRGNIPEKADNVYRYAKTIEINEIKRTLLMVTQDSNKKKVSAFFTKAKKQIEEDPELLQKFALATSKPVETTIVYGY